jgi:hypothetical protein
VFRAVRAPQAASCRATTLPIRSFIADGGASVIQPDPILTPCGLRCDPADGRPAAPP